MEDCHGADRAVDRRRRDRSPIMRWVMAVVGAVLLIALLKALGIFK
jgi:hypothetical protein